MLTEQFINNAYIYNSLHIQHMLQYIGYDWANRWQIEFNVVKRVTMHIATGNIKFQYSMHGR